MWKAFNSLFPLNTPLSEILLSNLQQIQISAVQNASSVSRAFIKP